MRAIGDDEWEPVPPEVPFPRDSWRSTPRTWTWLTGALGCAASAGRSTSSCGNPGTARLSYQQAATLFSEASGGATLHQLRHSALTHGAEDGTGTPVLMAR